MRPDLPTHIGPYRIVSKLGEGDQGVVMEGVEAATGRRVAIKVLHERYASSPAIQARLHNEARCASITDHPGIVAALEFGHASDGQSYVVMELLQGETLGQRIKARGSLPADDAMNLAHQIAAALAALHTKGIVHRDVEPENIMIISGRAMPWGERTKLLDFGACRLMQPDAGNPTKPLASLMVGSPLTMSPEQCRNAAHADGRSDVYSLGVLLYLMLSGRPPFSSESTGELLAMHCYMQPPDLTEAVPSLPEPLVRLVHSMLAKSPAGRPRMREVVSELARLRGTSDAIFERTESAAAPSEPEPPAGTPMTAPTESEALLSEPGVSAWVRLWRWLSGTRTRSR